MTYRQLIRALNHEHGKGVWRTTAKGPYGEALRQIEMRVRRGWRFMGWANDERHVRELAEDYLDAR